MGRRLLATCLLTCLPSPFSIVYWWIVDRLSWGGEFSKYGGTRHHRWYHTIFCSLIAKKSLILRLGESGHKSNFCRVLGHHKRGLVPSLSRSDLCSHEIIKQGQIFDNRVARRRVDLQERQECRFLRHTGQDCFWKGWSHRLYPCSPWQIFGMLWLLTEL